MVFKAVCTWIKIKYSDLPRAHLSRRLNLHLYFAINCMANLTIKIFICSTRKCSISSVCALLDGDRRHRDVYWERRLQDDKFQCELAAQLARDVEMQRAENLKATAAMADVFEMLFKRSASSPLLPPISTSLAPTILLPAPHDASQCTIPPPVSSYFQTQFRISYRILTRVKILRGSVNIFK